LVPDLALDRPLSAARGTGKRSQRNWPKKCGATGLDVGRLSITTIDKNAKTAILVGIIKQPILIEPVAHQRKPSVRQVIDSKPFISGIIRSIKSPPVSGRWAGVKDLPPEVVRTVAALASGKLDLWYLARTDPALIFNTDTGRIVYRTLASQVFSNTAPYTGANLGQDPEALVLFAASLLLANQSGFPKAYQRLLADLADARPQTELDTAMRAAGKSLMSGCKLSLGLDRPATVVWFFGVRAQNDAIPEMSAGLTGAVRITPLLSSRTEYGTYLVGKSVAFGRVKVKLWDLPARQVKVKS
jgi:hypothetical protein